MATSTSHYVRTVCLKDWWLIKADNNSMHNTLAIAGIESTEQPAARVFISAPIAKRFYFCTLKTADGVFVTLQGPINKERTRENGFSEEVFKYFFIGFPSNWENCTEKCFHQGIGSKATADADLNSDEAQEETADLQDDQNIDTIDEWSFRDARSNAENHDKDRHATVSVHDRDACVNDDKHDSDVGFREEVVRCSLRNKKVPYFEAKRACKVKHVTNLGKIKLRSKKTSDDTSTRPLVASLKDSQIPDMTLLCDESPKENANRLDFAYSNGTMTEESNGDGLLLPMHCLQRDAATVASIGIQTEEVVSTMDGVETQDGCATIEDEVVVSNGDQIETASKVLANNKESNHERLIVCARMVASSWAAESGILTNGDGELEINECKTPNDPMRWRTRNGVRKGAYCLRGTSSCIRGDVKLSLTMDELFDVMSRIKDSKCGDGDAALFEDESDVEDFGDSSSDEDYQPG